MTCSHCHTGLMVPERPMHCFNSADAEADAFTLDNLPAVRCIACGNIEDQIVLRNRARQREAAFAQLAHEITVARLFAGKGVAS